jgi:hypothetical protein
MKNPSCPLCPLWFHTRSRPANMARACLFIIVGLACSSTVRAQGTISGVVQEKESGEAVIGANVLVMNTERGAATNRFGYFAIADLDSGAYTLRVSAVGYATEYVRVALTRARPEARISVQLAEQPITAGEVVVEADRQMTRPMQVSAVDVPIEQIMRLPSLGGEVDLFRSLQLLPGVKASSELSSGLYIRGGSPDQNLILLDRMILYNPSHLFGFLSTFNADAINNVTLIKGAMNAEYGGRLSSVVDITMREGSKDGFHGSGGISMIDSRLTLEGPISEDATFMISGRRVYFDWIVQAFTDEAPTYYFYDLVAKTNWRLGESDRLYFSGFFGRDVLGEPPQDTEDFNISWGNSAGNLRWTHLFGSRLFTNLSAIVSDYRFQTDVAENSSANADRFKSVTGILDYSLRLEAEYFAARQHTIKAGVETVQHRFTTALSSNVNEFDEFVPATPGYYGLEFSVFAQDEWKPSERLTLNLGGRGFYFDRGKYFRAEPRLSAFYLFDDGTTLKAAFAGANQFLHLVSRNDISLPTDTWFPSTSIISPSYSLQYVLGASRNVFDDEYSVSLEGYYKSMHRLLEFKDNAIFSLFAPLESELTTGSGRAYGVEVFVEKKKGAFTGWVGYTLAWAWSSFPELNEGREYPPRYDRRHDVSIVLNYRLGETWEFTAVWVYGTGQAFTFPVALYGISPWDNYGSQYYSERNGYRLPAYHRLDLNFSHAFHWFDWDWKLSLNLYNAYNHLNPFSQSLERDWSTYPPTMRVKQITLFPIIPTLGLSFKF